MRCVKNLFQSVAHLSEKCFVQPVMFEARETNGT